MKRISFEHTPRSKNRLKATAFWTAAFLLLFASLSTFSLAEDLPSGPDDPDGGMTNAFSDDEAQGESGDPLESGDGEPSEPNENGDPAEPGEGDTVIRLFDSATSALTPDAIPTDEDALRDAVANAPDDGTAYVIEISNNITVADDDEMDILSDQNIILTGGGTVRKSVDRAIFWIDNGGRLTLAGDLTLSHNGEAINCVEVTHGGTFGMSGGAITGGNFGVQNEGTFNMSGGAITNCSVGVFVSGGTFNMSDGTVISNNEFGVINQAGMFTMYGGVIEYNVNSYFDGGGGIVNYDTFEMHGGTISDNRALYGGGLYAAEYSRILIAGGHISNNYAIYGGGLFLAGGYEFTMTGGEISNNHATDSGDYADGGGVYNCTTFRMTGGEIKGNTATGMGGGVYNAYGPMILTGGAIEGNTAVTGGGVANDDLLCMAGVTISRNTATAGGGGLYQSGSYNSRLRFGYDFNYVEMAGITVIERNEADLGGGLYFNGDARYDDQGPPASSIRPVAANSDGRRYSYAPPVIGYDGGGSNSVLVRYNNARNGGGVYFSGDGLLDDTLRITTNEALGEGVVGGFGGGVYAADYLDICGTNISGNTAKFGGGLYVTDYGKLLGGADFTAAIKDYHNVALSGNRATAGTFLPPGGDDVWDLPYADLYENGGGFRSYSRPGLGTAFTNDDINYVGRMIVTYQDSTGNAASGMPSPSALTLTATTSQAFAGDVFHRVAAGPAGKGNYVFKGWRLAGDTFAFLDGDTDTLRTLNGESAEILLAANRRIRPLADIVLDAVWGVKDSGGGGKPPGGGDEGGGDNPGGGDEGGGGDGGGGGTVTPPGGGGGGTPPGGGSTVPPARPAARPAPPVTVVANDLPEPVAPEPVIEAEAVTAGTPAPAETQPPRGNALENFLATTGLAPFGIPLAAPDGSAWAILNLILALLSVVTAVFAGLRLRKARADDAGTRTADSETIYGNGAGARERRPALTYTALAAAFALVSVVVFVLTEDLSLAPVWLDRFSPLMLALFVLCAVFFALAERTRRASRADADLEDAV